MKFLGIPNKLIRLTKATIEDSTYHVKIVPMMTDGFQGRKWLETGRQTGTLPI
jgi:hypothetical protein